MELKEYVDIIFKRLWIVVASTLVFAIISAVVSFYFIEPIYQSNTTLYVGKDSEDQKGIVYNDLLAGGQLVKDYRELVKSRLIANMVIQQLGLKMSTGQLSSKLGVNLKNETRLIEITAQDTNADTAREIANQVALAFKTKAIELIDVRNVHVIDVAEKPMAPIKPNKMLNIAIATFVGLMAGLGIIFILEYLDNTVKTVEDVRKHVNLPVIGTIVEFSNKI